MAGTNGNGRERADPPLISELLQSIPDPVIGCDRSGRVVYWSAAAGVAYGYEAKDVLGERVLPLLRTRFPRPLLEIVEELGDLGCWEGRLVHRHRDGAEVEVDSRWAARYDEAGELAGAFAVERVAVGANGDDGAPPPGTPPAPEPIRDLGRLTGAVAHELNNALSVILNYTSFVATELERLDTAPTDSERASISHDLGEVHAAARRAADLTERLHQLASRAATGDGRG
jgi:PAS domain S-box-containing protein